MRIKMWGNIKNRKTFSPKIGESMIHYQLENFVQILSKDLSKPYQKFVHQMIFGIQTSKDIKLSEISRRALNEEIKLIKTENRLLRNLTTIFPS